MNTKCYCICCIHHPLHAKRDEFPHYFVSWHPGDYIPTDYHEQGADVDCLKPRSEAFYELDKQPEDFQFPATAYEEGIATTYAEGKGFCIFALCEREFSEE